MEINDRNYDLLWKWDMSYLFMSIYLESGYKKNDTISYNDNETNYLFISKKSRKKLSKKGLKLYTSGFNTYKTKAKKSISVLQSYLKKEKKINLTTLNKDEFIKKFREMVKYLRKSWTDYFEIEPHHADLVSSIISSKTLTKNKQILEKNLKLITPIRQMQREMINQVMYKPGPFYKYTKEAEKRLKKDISFFNYQQVISLLQGKNIQGVKSKHIILSQFNNWKPITGEKAIKIFKKLLPFEKDQKELIGAIANKGLYKGRVRKIEFGLNTDFEKEMKLMKKGEVLVSGSTGPEMMMACKKAGAIVVEEGGVLSHAAIVSREFGIPCIVGTKIATKILDTGDLVKVDANKGIVTKLS